MKRRLAGFIERARSEPGLKINLVAIAALMVVGSFFAAYFLSNQRFNPPWEDKYSVYATFDEAAAVSPGNGQEVRIAGISVGDIRSTDVNKDGEAVLELRIDKAHKVYNDAQVVLRPKSPLNDMYIELNPGTKAGKKLADGDVLPVANSVSPVQIDQILGNLDANTRSAVTSLLAEADVALAQAPSKLPEGLKATDKVVKDLRPVMTQLDTRRERLARMVTALSRISAATGENDERLTRLADSLQRTLSTVAGDDDDLNATLAQLPDLATQLRRSSTSVSGLVDQLDPTLDNVLAASDTLPGAFRRVGDSTAQLESFLDEARPVVKSARPVVRDLRPAVGDLRKVAGDLRPITADFKPLTKTTVSYLDDLSAFVYNTNSVASLRDANRGILRGLFAISPDSIPAGLR